MKKVIKIVLIVTLILVILGFSGCAAILHTINDRNTNYYKYATPVGTMETKYTSLGDYEVSYVEYDADNDVYGKYEVWYPSDMQSSGQTYPLVVMANGTGIKASQYKEVFNHLASWGFIVVGNEDENSRTGASSAATLDYMLRLNEEKTSEFCGRINADKIGIAGHSQGGVGAINAVTEQDNGYMYNAIFAASTTSRYHTDEMNKSNGGWSCDTAKVDIPIFMVAGTNFMDAGNMNEYSTGTLPKGSAQGICPLWWMNECYDAIPDSVSKVIAREVDKDHGDMLRSADAYMTAWFMYWLKDDAESGNIFTGTDAEILKNSNYQDVRDNIN
ncbi:MAG: chlorophyllase/cutinase-like alpha/beta fold protein [Suipraeoptans sp.]